jgi:hypothetical protein
MVAIPVLVSCLFAVCGSTSASQVQLGQSKPSDIEGLPVPTHAVLIHKTTSGSTSSSEYAIHTSVSALNQWYRTQLPRGRPWRSWGWLPTTGPHCLNLFRDSPETWQWKKGPLELQLTPLGNKANDSNGLSFVTISRLPLSPLTQCQ